MILQNVLLKNSSFYFPEGLKSKSQFVEAKQLNKIKERKQKQIADTSFLLSNIQKRKGEFMEELKNADKKASAQREKLERLPISQLSF